VLEDGLAMSAQVAVGLELGYIGRAALLALDGLYWHGIPEGFEAE
jgi:hypothetical protein